MNVSHIISELSPLNSNEKVDALILKMSENNVIMTMHAKFAIRDAIKDDNVLEYFYENYDGSVSEMDLEKERKRQRRAKQERKKILEDRNNYLLSSKNETEELCGTNKKPRKDTDTPRTKYKGSVLRTMKIFGKDSLKVNKKRKENKKKAQSNTSNKKRPISTTSSVHTISIASGGMNKRY